MKESNEFGKNIHELLSLLKKILRSQKVGTGNSDLSSLLDKKNVNLNLCFFTFLPMTEEEFADFEYELEEAMGESGEAAEDLAFELTKGDMDFLKKYGLKF